MLSFRRRLALLHVVVVTTVLAVAATLTYLSLVTALRAQLDGALLALAEQEASILAASPGLPVAVHEPGTTAAPHLRPAAEAAPTESLDFDAIIGAGSADADDTLTQPKRRERRVLGRFQHHAVPCGERRRQLPDRHLQRVVPRHHRTDHAERLPRDQRQLGVAGRRDLAIQLVDRLGVPLHDGSGAGHVELRGVADQLAGVDGVQQRQLGGVGRDQFGEAQQNALLAL